VLLVVLAWSSLSSLIASTVFVPAKAGRRHLLFDEDYTLLSEGACKQYRTSFTRK
jgi:hypothetical protein